MLPSENATPLRLAGGSHMQQYPDTELAHRHIPDKHPKYH